MFSYPFINTINDKLYIVHRIVRFRVSAVEVWASVVAGWRQHLSGTLEVREGGRTLLRSATRRDVPPPREKGMINARIIGERVGERRAAT